MTTVALLATDANAAVNIHDNGESPFLGSPTIQVRGHACNVLSEHSRLRVQLVNASCSRVASQVPDGQGSHNYGHGTDGQFADRQGSDHSLTPTTNGEPRHDANGQDGNDRNRRHLSSPATPNTSQSYELGQRTVTLSSAWGATGNRSNGSVHSASCRTHARDSNGHNHPLNISQSQSKA